MTWSDTPIDGQQSVAANKTPINDAFTYIANTMKNDHFWDNANANLDGRHQFVQMPETTNTVSGVIRPNFGVDMDAIYYARQKTAGEAPDKQLIEAYYAQKDGAARHTLQLGFRALASFDVNQSSFAITEKYIHNCTVTRQGEGQYRLTFSVPLPSDEYIVLGTAMRTSGSALTVGIQSDATITDKIKTNQVDIAFSSTNAGDLRDPLRAMIAVCGG